MKKAEAMKESERNKSESLLGGDPSVSRHPPYGMKYIL